MNEFKSTVSVVIPAYNAFKTLPETIASALNQTFAPIEIVVVDDASTDATATLDILKHPLVKYVRCETNGGGSAARNLGVLNARGDWIAFLDADDRWATTKLEKQMKLLGDDANADSVCVTNYQIIGTLDRGRRTNRRPMEEGETVTHYLFGSEGNRLQCSSFVVPRRACVAHPFRQETAPHDDWDFLINLQRSGYRIHYLHEILVDYLDHSLFARVSKQKKTEASLAWISELTPTLSAAERAGIFVNTLYSRKYYRIRPFLMLGKLMLARRYGVITTKRLLTNSIRIILGDRNVERLQQLLTSADG